MRTHSSKLSLVRSGLAASVLLLASGLSFAAPPTVSLTAAGTQAVLPDGQSVPMWGYSCGAVVQGTSPAPTTGTSCVAANSKAAGNWSPIVITVPYTEASGVSSTSLTINLTNNLSFSTTTTPNNIPTSIVIVGQLGGGLGGAPTTTSSPDHSAAQTVTWPAADPTTPGAPPPQGPRVQSFGTEVAATPSTTVQTPTALTWTGLKPGTYLIESGTHPSIQGPMGLYGVLVVTDATTGTAYPAITKTGANNVVTVVRNAVTYTAEVPLILSEIDPVQNRAVDAAVRTANFSETKVWSGLSLPGSSSSGCGSPTLADGTTVNPDYNTCYPPAVNYDPRYYLVNGTSFDAANPTNSLFGALPVSATGPVLVRLVNAGLRMHVPAIVGATVNADSPSTVGTTVPGLALIAEDGNVLPGRARVQNEVFMAAGKTVDVMISGTGTKSLPLFDRQLSLSTNNQHNGGMLSYITTQPVATAGLVPTTGISVSANPDSYTMIGGALLVADPSKGVLANDVGVYGATLVGAPIAGLTFNANGTFDYKGTAPPPVFTYCANGTVSGTTCSSGKTATVTITACTTGACAAAPVVADVQFTSNVSGRYASPPPGVLGSNVTNASGLPLTAAGGGGGVTLNLDGSFVATGTGSTCSPTLSPPAPTGATCVTFPFHVLTSAGVPSAPDNTATVIFLPPSGLVVNVKDALNGKAINDYRWIIEEDRTFWVDPKCQINTLGARVDSNGRPCTPLPVESLGYNFHTANMPVVAQGCVVPVDSTGAPLAGSVSCEDGQTLLGQPAVCDKGNGVCRSGADVTVAQKTPVLPGQVYLDPAKRYYISILPGDGITSSGGGGTGAVPAPHKYNTPATNPDPDTWAGAMRPFDIATDCGPYDAGSSFWMPGGSNDCGHAMGGAQIAAAPGSGTAATPPAQVGFGPRPAVNISLQETPLPTAKIAVFVFEDDRPLNGENDAGGGVDVLAPNEPGLGGFEVKLFDQAGGLGDATGQITYDMFNEPVSNALAGQKDPITGLNACPITRQGDGTIVGMIPTCPEFESDGRTQSPLAGQAVIANLYPGLYEIVATPAADRIAKGQEWLQSNTLDGGKAHEAFIRANEPAYFQEFGPGGFHVSIGFTNPKTINDRRTNAAGTGICDPAPNGGGQTCNSTLDVHVTSAHMSRSPDQRLFSTETYDAYGFTQCYVGIGIPDDIDFAFAKCDPSGKAHFDKLPAGDYKLTVFDQWNDLMLDGLVSPVSVGANPDQTFPVTQWRSNLNTDTFIDTNGNGVRDDGEAGLALVATNIRYRDGSFGFFNNTDLNGAAGFNEVFPFMNWLVVEADTTRYKSAGTHVVYDAGGNVDGTQGGGTASILDHVGNTVETIPLPSKLRVPGAFYCAGADCADAATPFTPGGAGGSTGRVDPASVGATEAWQGLLGQYSYIGFAKKPFVTGENGGIHGHVIYASTRPFDDPALLLQLSWEPGVPRVKLNLYKEDVAPDGSNSMTLVDTTQSSSWDDWAQGFRRDASGNLISSSYTYVDAGGTSHTVTGYVPNMNCPGQDATSPFFQTLRGSKQWLDTDTPKKALAADSLFKCYDGWSQLNQVQPAPYDGMYKFPSTVAIDPATGKPAGGTGPVAGSNCSICVANPDDGTPMLPAGKYVVEVVVPAGFELVKEEDKNILLGDTYVAPVEQQFAGFGNIFIMPDQAAVGAAYNKNNPINPGSNFGLPHHEGDTGSVEAFWPCVGAMRVVPDFNSLYPKAGQNSPFAGATRPLCDRKEVTLEDQMSVLAKFYIFNSTHIAGHFTGTITNDFASEFDPFSPQFGEKFGPPNLPVGLRDFSGTETARVYSDQWGIYNGLYFSTYGVNPPNPTGYVPQMAITCMNDPGPIARTNSLGQFITKDPATGAETVVLTAALADQITDPAYNAAYSNFCYEQPFMPGFTAYMDTPVIPTQAFADGYNLPDSELPDLTPAIASVTGDAIPGSTGSGPWVSAAGAGHTLTITALGDKVVQNPNFSGPNAPSEPYNQKTITRHYVFGTTAGTVALVGRDGIEHPLTDVSWGNTSITGTVPTGVPACTVQQRGQSNAQCGELVITAANGKRSIDTVTVTIGGKSPKYVTPSTTVVPGNFGKIAPTPLQDAIDAAAAGDLIIVGPGTYRENLLMWKPVRLQGVGAALVTINADAHPSGKMDAWRRQVNCVFGLTLDGTPNLNDTRFDSNGKYVCPRTMHQRVDRIPFEAIVGWDAGGNGNLAQVLQEPTLMGAYEGAGITVLGRGVRVPNGNTDFWGVNATGGPGAFTDGSVYLNSGDCDAIPTGNNVANGRDYGTSNYFCNPSRIDGVSIIISSQGGGGVFIHGWAHYLEVANTRISGNHGTLAGAINLGNGETPDAFINDGVECGVTPAVMPCPPIPNGTALNAAIPFQFDTHVRIHHNQLYNNASIGDALFSGTPAGAGGITVSSGGDDYLIDHNWIAGNLSTGDGGGVQHLGLSFRGKISNNYVLYNQSTNPTLPTNGGGVVVEGANLDRFINGQECGSFSDQDCPPGLGDGTGPGIVIDSNLILGNSAESGSGAGLRIQQVNGSEMAAFPTNSSRWYDVSVTNNVIANNVAGWDGAGISMQDAMRVSIINNTIASNDTTASAGVLFKTIGVVNSASGGPNCNTDPNDPAVLICPPGDAAHGPQPAGLVTMRNTANLIDALPSTQAVNCPAQQATVNIASISRTNGNVTVNTATPVSLTVGATVTIAGTGNNTLNGTKIVTAVNSTTRFHYTQGTGNTQPAITNRGNVTYITSSVYAQPTGTNASCKLVSMPVMVNNILWGNRAFHVDILRLGTGLQSQQNIIGLAPILNQATTGQCVGGTAAGAAPIYWDIGIRQDDLTTSPNTPAGSINPAVHKLTLNNSILSVAQEISGGTYGSGADQATYYAINGSGNQATAAAPVVAQFCNGARVPPEHCPAPVAGEAVTCNAFNAPAGRSETTGLSQLFTFQNITPAATVDEGHNWLNLTYGPLTLTLPAEMDPAVLASPTNAREQMIAAGSAGTLNGAYSLPTGSAAINGGLNAPAPATDFFGNARQRTAADPADIGAVERVAPPAPIASITPTSLAFGNVVSGFTSAAQTLTLHNTGNAGLTGINVVVTAPFNQLGGTCGAVLAAGSNCTITVTFSPTALGAANGTATVTGNVTVTGSPVPLTGTGVVAPTRPNLGVLDNFNRATANNLGGNWNQPPLVGALRVVDVTPANPSTGVATSNSNNLNFGVWNAANSSFSAKQGAQFAFTNPMVNADYTLFLKASGTAILGVYPNYIKVVYTNGSSQIVVSTCTNSGVNCTAQGTLAGSFAAGDTITAVANADGSVDVWKNTTYLGSSAAAAGFTGTGRIGMALPNTARVDNFSGGTAP